MFIKARLSAPRTFGVAIIASLVAGLGGCNDGKPGNVAEANKAVAIPDPSPAPAAPVTIAALGRETLLLAVARAASAAAGGIDDSKAQAELDGRQFTFRMRFGCSGVRANEAGPLSWTYDAAKQVLRVVATPDIKSDSPPVAAMAGPEVEEVQGFWVQQPWLFTESCPAVAGAPVEGAQAEVGLAQYFTADQSRVERRSRPFQAVQRMAPENAPGEEGLALMLSGRLKQLPDGRVIKCVPNENGRRPVCVASVEFDRVTVENPATGAVISEWGVG